MNRNLPLGLRFSIIHRFFKRQLDKHLSELDLTGVQFGVLSALVRLERTGAAEVNQRDLENASRVTHPTMTEIIKRLEKKGFICCHQRQTDRRYKCVCSTDKAASLQTEMAQTDELVFKQLCAGLSEEQIASFIEITDVMLDNAFKCKEGCDCCNDPKACGQHTGV